MAVNKLSKVDALAIIKQAANQHPFLKTITQIQKVPQLLTGGVLNDVYQVKTDQGTLVIKWFNGKQLDPSATASHDEIFQLLKHLHKHDAPTPEPYGFVKQYKGSDVILMQYLEGESPKFLDETQAYLLGKKLAEFHAITDSFPRLKKQPNDVASLFSEIWQSISRALIKLQPIQEWQYLRVLGGYVIGTISYSNPKASKKGLRHGDLHQGNIKFFKEQPYFLDFELCANGLLIDDLANLLCMFGLENENQVNVNTLRTILKGYESVRSLSADEWAYLDTALRNRVGLERVGNKKLDNSNLPPGTIFNETRSATLLAFLDKQRTKGIALKQLLQIDLAEDVGEAALARGSSSVLKQQGLHKARNARTTGDPVGSIPASNIKSRKATL